MFETLSYIGDKLKDIDLSSFSIIVLDLFASRRILFSSDIAYK